MLANEKRDILERLERAGLTHSVISLSGIYKEIIVHEATGNTQRFIGKQAMQVDGDENIPADMKAAILSLYIPVMACSKGDLPKSHDEFFDMKNDDIEKWVFEARRLNPGIFGLLTEQEKFLQGLLSEAEVEGKKKKPSKSRKRS